MNFLSTILLSVILVFTQFSSSSDKREFDELYRPQFHFSAEKNWLNDPNGLVYYDGEYHLFYQYNPNGNEWGYMHWGHAISTDLVHWQHLPIAIYPDENSTDKEHCTAFSGSAIVDEKNLLGKQQGVAKTLVAFYTSQNCGQRIAYSTDKGRTWEKYEENPIIPLEDDDARDPKVFWNEESQKWVMVLYRRTSEDLKTRGISIYNSDNLVDWTWKSHIPGFFECPDLIKLKVTNRPAESKWILFDGDGSYVVGSFNGEIFTPETGKIKSDFGANYYATQTWSNIPEEDGRTIQIAWMKGGKYPGMPFTGQMTIPCELSLTQFSFGYKLVRNPVREIETLHEKHYNWKNKNLIPGINENIVKGVKDDCLHIKGEFNLKTADSFGFMIRNSRKVPGTEIRYDVKRGALSILNSTMPIVPVDNKISLDILVDRSSIEIFANEGQSVVSNCFTPEDGADELVLFTNGGELEVIKLDIYKMNSIYSEK
jgi:fructan beta-fructosidase